MVVRIAFFVAALWAATQGAQVVQAQDEAGERARTLFDQGVAFSTDERWADALVAFEASRALVERPSTVFNIATALQRLGRPTEAIRAAQEYLALSHVRRDAERRAAATMLIDVLRTTLATLTLHVEPAGAALEIDGRVEPGDGSERVLALDPGDHRLVTSAAGYVGRRDRVVLASGERRSIRILLRAPPPQPSFLSVRSSVRAALVSIDERAVGRAFLEREMRPGVHRVRVTADGYVRLERRVELAPGQHLRIDATLLATPTNITREPWFWIAIGGALLVAAVTTGVLLATRAGSLYLGNTEKAIEALSW